MTDTTSTNARADTLRSLLKDRFSCRGYRSDPVPQSEILKILKLAQRSASWCNVQPWQVFITRGEATERLRQCLLLPEVPGEPGPDFDWPGAYEGIYQTRRRECGLALYEAVGVARGDRAASAREAKRNFELFGAPHVAIVASPKALGTYGAIDCGAWVANFLLAATAYGVATVAQAALAAHPQRVSEFFDLGPEWNVVCGVSFGYADAAHPANGFRTTRADLVDNVTFVDSVHRCADHAEP